MSLIKFVLTLLFLNCCQLYAQVYYGTIQDEYNSETLIGVNILLDGKGVTTSDVDGNFSLNLTEEKHTITFSYIGFKNEVRNIQLKNGESKQETVMMADNAKLIETVVVSAGKFEQRIEETTVSVEVIKPTFISNKNTTNIKRLSTKFQGLTLQMDKPILEEEAAGVMVQVLGYKF